MDYKEIWRGGEENPLKVWTTKYPRERLYIGKHEDGYTSIISMSLEEALVVARAIVDELSEGDLE